MKRPGPLPDERCFDRELTRDFLRWVAPWARRYFRAEVRGAELLPTRQTLIVSHHDGGMMPIDSMFIGQAYYDRFGFARPLHVLVHDMVLRFAGPLRRLGAVLADRENLVRLLEAGHSVLLYPGAAQETFRPFSERQTLSLGHRIGFVRLALKRRVLLSPVVSAGVHETFIVLTRGAWLAKLLRFRKLFRAEVFPIVAGLPFGLWFGAFFPQLPLPAKITVQFLPPLDVVALAERFLGRALQPTDTDDDDLVLTCFYRLRENMQTRLTELYAERNFPVIG